MLTKNFSLSEFQSRDGSTTPDSVILNIQKLANNLQIIRDAINAPITINSGYRSPTHNKNIGGVSNSQHVLGKAADITAKGYSSSELHEIILDLIKQGKIINGGVGLYDGFVHYDVRDYSARWSFLTEKKNLN
ncbi:peptidase [Cellulophaga phage phi48:2]|uniref:endolysin n=1 Tax=Cellulophaga phage phi48:2 TaxID=1327968 RepID=UPI000351D7AA|nr:endolysin [Cellulophaga phage phi48:2]AGO47266.1 peptidase [Cellulophaga phage phi48:2]